MHPLVERQGLYGIQGCVSRIVGFKQFLIWFNGLAFGDFMLLVLVSQILPEIAAWQFFHNISIAIFFSSRSNYRFFWILISKYDFIHTHRKNKKSMV